MATVNLVSDQQNNALAASAELSFLHKKGLEVVWAERLFANPAAVRNRGRAGHEFGVVLYAPVFVFAPDSHKRLNQPSDRARGWVVGVEVAPVPGTEHAEVVRVNVSFVVYRVFELSLGRGRTERLVAGRAFGQPSDLESLRGWVADDDRISMTPVRPQWMVSYRAEQSTSRVGICRKAEALQGIEELE